MRSRLDIMSLQEVHRGVPGWSAEKQGRWNVLTYQGDDSWRGTGVMYDASVWSIMRRVCSKRGTWFRFRNLATRREIWVGSLYIPPHYATLEFRELLDDHLQHLPATTLPVFLSADLNAAIKCQQHQETITAYGEESKTRSLLDALHQRGLQICPPPESQFCQPTSRPRKPGAVGRAIDWVASARGGQCRSTICTDSCFELGTDHDAIVVESSFRASIQQSATSGVRVVTSTPVLGNKIDQPELRRLASTHTAPPRRQGYRDSQEVRGLFCTARTTRQGSDWCRALRARKQAHQRWTEQKVSEAMAGDWQALRACKRVTGAGWEASFADHAGEADPHALLHDHYSKLFDKGQHVEDLSHRHQVLTLPRKSLGLRWVRAKLAKAWDKMGSAWNY